MNTIREAWHSLPLQWRQGIVVAGVAVITAISEAAIGWVESLNPAVVTF